MAFWLKTFYVGKERMVFRGSCSCIITFCAVPITLCEYSINHNLTVTATVEMQLSVPHPYDKDKATISK